MSDEEKFQGLRVNDRRRFDSAGNERDDEKPAVQKPMAEAPKQATPQPVTPALAKPAPAETQTVNHTTPESREPEFADDDGEINFSSFVVSLATQALMQLGEMQPPPGVELPQDVVGAKQTIDILAMLQAKTKGNLDGSEQKLMTEILHNLRLSFVRRSGAKK